MGVTRSLFSLFGELLGDRDPTSLPGPGSRWGTAVLTDPTLHPPKGQLLGDWDSTFPGINPGPPGWRDVCSAFLVLQRYCNSSTWTSA